MNDKNNKILILSGPTYSNGEPHLGTISNLVIKDSLNRFHNLNKIKNIALEIGFDNHGIPISNKILTKKKQKNPKYNEFQNVKSFRKECYEYAIKQSIKISKSFQKMNIHLNEKNIYFTCSLSYIKKNLKVLNKIYKNKLLNYKLKTIHWCLKCKTSLSLAEIEEKIKNDVSIFIKFQLNNNDNNKKIYLIVFTTKPWTLLFNQAIAYNNELKYILIKFPKKIYITTQEFIEKYQNNIAIKKILKDSKIEKINNIQDFLNLHVNQQNNFYKNLFTKNSNNKHFKILINSKRIVNKFGSGFVHLASDFGLDDYNICQNIYSYQKKNNIIFEENKKKRNYKIPPYRAVNNLNKIIFCNVKKFINDDFEITKLNQYVLNNLKNNIILKINYKHVQPLCWRCKEYLIIRSSDQLFININLIKKKLQKIFDYKKNQINSNKKINNYLKREQIKFFNTLFATIKNRNDWCISRQIPWGTALPLFICSKCNYKFINQQCFNFFYKLKNHDELNDLFKYSFKYAKIKKIIPKIYNIKCPKCLFHKSYFFGDTLDIWFDSGIAWYIYKKRYNKNQISLYTEGYDQFRGWFQSSFLTYIAYHFNSIEQRIKNNMSLFPYKFLLCHGYVLNEKSQKLSKSKQNYNNDLLAKINPEILRLFILSSKYTSEIKLNNNKLKDTIKQYEKIKYFFQKIILIINNNKKYNNRKNIIKNLQLLKKNIFLPIYNDHYLFLNNQNNIDESFYINRIFLHFIHIFITSYNELKTFKFLHFLNIFIKKSNTFLKLNFFKTQIGHYALINLLNILLKLISPILPKTVQNIKEQNKKLFNNYRNINFLKILSHNIKFSKIFLNSKRKKSLNFLQKLFIKDPKKNKITSPKIIESNLKFLEILNKLNNDNLINLEQILFLPYKKHNSIKTTLSSFNKSQSISITHETPYLLMLVRQLGINSTQQDNHTLLVKYNKFISIMLIINSLLIQTNLQNIFFIKNFQKTINNFINTKIKNNKNKIYFLFQKKIFILYKQENNIDTKDNVEKINKFQNKQRQYLIYNNNKYQIVYVKLINDKKEN